MGDRACDGSILKKASYNPADAAGPLSRWAMMTTSRGSRRVPVRLESRSSNAATLPFACWLEAAIILSFLAAEPAHAGLFGPPRHIDFLDRVLYVTAADLNRDGRLDAV